MAIANFWSKILGLVIMLMKQVDI